MLRDDEQPGALLVLDKFGEVLWHGGLIVRNQHTPLSGGTFQHLRIKQSCQASGSGRLKIHAGFASHEGRHNHLMQISISLEANFHGAVSNWQRASAIVAVQLPKTSGLR
jgi:hypothetical protein